MNRFRTRITLAITFLVMIQMACGCSINRALGVHVYQDLNANGTQDAGEPDFEGIALGFESEDYVGVPLTYHTDQSGNAAMGDYSKYCRDLRATVDSPAGYTVTQDEKNPSNWDFGPAAIFFLIPGYTAPACPSTFESTNQSMTRTIGLAPVVTMTKSASPTTFSATGQTIAYSYVIKNLAQNDLSDVSVTDDKAAVSCPTGTVAAGASLTCKATYTITEQDMNQGSVTNTASFSGSFGTNNFTGAPVSATVTRVDTQSVPPPPSLTTSVLSGEVITLCDTVNRPVNLRLASGTDPALVTQELANQNLRILIAQRDISSTCHINLSNSTLLSCTYPSGLTSLPAQGQVIYKNTVIKTFSFDGESGCTAPKSQPPACDPHTDPACPLDCTNPANADLCG